MMAGIFSQPVEPLGLGQLAEMQGSEGEHQKFLSLSPFGSNWQYSVSFSRTRNKTAAGLVLVGGLARMVTGADTGIQSSKHNR